MQNAPSLTVVAPANKLVYLGEMQRHSFTLTNTGNATGTFALPSDAVLSGTASGMTLDGYVLNSASTGVCSSDTPCDRATLNAQSGMGGVAPSGTVSIWVVYTAGTNSSVGQTIISTLSATITYAALSGAVAETSASASASITDTFDMDARLDVTASGVNSGSNITWTITANDGGTIAASGLTSVKTLLGSANAGIAIFIAVPSFNSTYLTLQSSPATPTLSGASSGATATWYYNTTACSSAPTTGWSTTYTSGAKCLAISVSNTSTSVLPTATSGSSGAGSVSAPQITAVFTTNQPTWSGSGNASSITLNVNSVIGGRVWYNNVYPILGQGVALGTGDAATASLLNGILTNTTASSGTVQPGGAVAATGNATVAYSLRHGPYGNAGATGWYPGATGTPNADTSHDFTASTVPCTSNGGTGVNSLPCAVSSSGVAVINEILNTGNSSDSIQIAATAAAGYMVQLYAASSCSGGGSTTPSCTQGSALTSQSTSGGSVSATVTVAS